MKRIAASSCLILLTARCFLGQADNRIPPKAEQREAQIVAANFFNQYQKTQDLSPLIKRFFIKDFATRVKFCGTTGECGGFGRDFWQKNEELSSLNGTKKEYERLYINAVNYWFLYFRSIVHLARPSGQKPSEFEKAGRKELQERLSKELRNSPELLKFSLFEEMDEPPLKAKTLREFDKRLTDSEKFSAALRVVERKLRAELLRKQRKSRVTVSPKEFRVYKEPNKEGFFHYPVDVQMFDVWSDNDFIFFKMDMIRERGKLRIVAVYPPID